MLGTGLSAISVVIVLEFILAVYSVGLAFCTNGKILKIVHGVLAVVWVVLALLNMSLSTVGAVSLRRNSPVFDYVGL